MPEIGDVLDARINRPDAIATAAQRRRRPQSLFGPHGKLMIIAADHPARGALRAGADPLAMANRVDLLDRIRTALAARKRMAMALGLPTVQGLVIGRSLLYPPTGTVADAVDRAVTLL